MKNLKKIGLIVLSIIIILFLWATWYTYEYSMEVAQTFEVNSPDFEKKLLIATQGSAFKDSITKGIVNHFKSDSIFIKVIDISSLQEIKPEDYNALVVIHTWENWKPPTVVRQFMDRTIDFHDKMVVLTTSGQGSYTITQIDALYTMENIDALAGESNLEDVPDFAKNIVARLEPIIN